ncbi:LysE family translocator [Microbispora corallina]|uniref:LysE family translocator n=1 Tax=Microbispora corallina TaxID=83302 RepID=A0ABQ4FTW0_9ACTN|nr:LysE family transporter [Microbispora corallina]GIH38272.1 LysE family translocator [Microbispora corallina]
MPELLMGLSLGLGAGVTPGALLTLVITASLRGGFRAGMRLACVPLLSDLPVVLLSVTAVGAMPAAAVRVLSVVGGLYVVYLGVSTAREARTAEPPRPGADAPTSAADVLRGVVVNVLNPHPWLFWIVVGSPLFVAAWGRAPASALAFLAGFYVVLVGSKLVLAWAVGAGRHRLTPRGYRLLLGGSGLLLAGVGAVLTLRGLLPS